LIFGLESLGAGIGILGLDHGEGDFNREGSHGFGPFSLGV
jgi:hypothetical protein